MTSSKPSLISSTLAWFLFAMILANTASAMTFVVLSVYLTDELNATVEQVGLVFTLASVVPTILQVFGGWLSDSLGRLRTIAIGSAVATFGYLGLFLAPTWQWALVALALEYVSGAMVGPSFGSFIAEQSTEENRGRVFGLSKGIFQVVGVIGPFAGGLIAGRIGFRQLMFAGFILYTLASILRIWMALTPKFASASPKSIQPLSLSAFSKNIKIMFGLLVSGGLITWIFITDGVRDIAFRLSGELQPLYLVNVGNISIEAVGLLHAVVSLVTIGITIAAGWLSDRWGERMVIASGFFFQFIALVTFVMVESLPGFFIVALLFGLGIGLMMPAYDSLVSKAVPENMRGIAFGIFYSSLGLLSLPAPWVGAYLWETFSPRLPFAITALAALISILPVWLKFKLPSRPVEPNLEEMAQSPSTGEAIL